MKLTQMDALHTELGKESGFRVCGIRDGLLFRFEAHTEPDVQKHAVKACDCVVDTVIRLAQLLHEDSVVEIEGARLGELERIGLEQRLSKQLGKNIGVRLRAKKESVKIADSYTHIGTVRGGVHLKTDGDLLVVGDVHVGARLQAGGNVFVMGALEGVAIVGENSIVCAYRLAPSEIRIGEACLLMDAMDKKADMLPEYAYLCDGAIKINKYHDKK